MLFTMNIKKLIETKQKMTVDSCGRDSEEGHSTVKEDAKENGVRKMMSVMGSKWTLAENPTKWHVGPNRHQET